MLPAGHIAAPVIVGDVACKGVQVFKDVPDASGTPGVAVLQHIHSMGPACSSAQVRVLCLHHPLSVKQSKVPITELALFPGIVPGRAPALTPKPPSAYVLPQVQVR